MTYRNFSKEKTKQHLLGERGEQLILKLLQMLYPDKEWQPADNWYDARKDILIRSKKGDYLVEVKTKAPFFRKNNALTIKRNDTKCFLCDELWFVSVFPNDPVQIYRIFPKKKIPSLLEYDFYGGAKRIEMYAMDPNSEGVNFVATVDDPETVRELRQCLVSRHDLGKLSGT